MPGLYTSLVSDSNAHLGLQTPSSSHNVHFNEESLSRDIDYNSDGSMRTASPLSFISVASSAGLFRREYGRELNNYSSVYQLPADGEEFERLGIPLSLIRLPWMLLIMLCIREATCDVRRCHGWKIRPSYGQGIGGRNFRTEKSLFGFRMWKWQLVSDSRTEFSR